MTGAESDSVPNGGFGGTPGDQPSWPPPPPFGGGNGGGGEPPTQPFGGAAGEQPTQPFGGPWPQQGGSNPTAPFAGGPFSPPPMQPTEPGVFGAPSEPGAFGPPIPGGGWPQGYADYPGSQPGPVGGQFPMQQPQKSGNGRFVAALVGTLAVVTAVGIALLLVTGNHSGSSSPVADASQSSSPANTSSPTDASAGDASTAASTDNAGTSAAFDASELDSASTDPAPFTTDALLPDSLTDSKGVDYSLEGAGVHSCVQDQMSSDVQSVMRRYGCSQVLTGSYTVDSSTVTSNSDVLVSVEIFAFKDDSTAHAVYDSFSANGSWDFGIWCPKSGNGAKPCSASSSEYDAATKSESEVDDYRYVIEATALYTNLTTDSSAKEWTDAAVKEAIASCGPEYYISSQN